MTKRELSWCLRKTTNPTKPIFDNAGDGYISVLEKRIVLHADHVPERDSKENVVGYNCEKSGCHFLVLKVCRIGWIGNDNLREVVRAKDEMAKYTKWVNEWRGLQHGIDEYAKNLKRILK